MSQACKLAIDGGWAVNLGGGFGYNTSSISKGLAIYDDIPVCLAVSYITVAHVLIHACLCICMSLHMYIIHEYPGICSLL